MSVFVVDTKKGKPICIYGMYLKSTVPLSSKEGADNLLGKQLQFYLSKGKTTDNVLMHWNWNKYDENFGNHI